MAFLVIGNVSYFILFRLGNPFRTSFHSWPAVAVTGRMYAMSGIDWLISPPPNIMLPEIATLVMKMYYNRIKLIREEIDKTQQELAHHLKLTRSTYSNYENNIQEIPIWVLSAIVDFYQTSMDYLIGRTDERKPYPSKKE